MNRKHCKGCHDDVYNNGLGGSKECWMLSDAKLVMKKRVSIHHVPPWNQKPVRVPSCYNEPQVVYVEANRTH